MELFNKLDLCWFMIAFAIGIYVVYIIGPKPNIMYKYPSPNDDTVYSDLANNCYKFIAEKAKCINAKLVPLQFL